MKQFCCTVVWSISLFWSFMILQATAKTCCIALPSEDKFNGCGVDNTFYWPIANITKSLTESCTVLQLSPKNYILTENLDIAAVNNFSIIGNGATFVCNSSCIIIENSIRIKIHNVRFLNCGCTIKRFSKIITSYTKAAIILYNSSSVTVMSATFENSCGHGIIGVNMIGKSFFENISMFHASYNDSLCNQEQTLKGGILLIYVNIIMDYTVANNIVDLLIKHCIISNIDTNHKAKFKHENSLISLDHLNSVFGLIFHQQILNKIEIQINNLTMTNITSVNGSLILVSIVSNAPYALKLQLSESTFINNKNDLNYLNPMIRFLLNSTEVIQTNLTVTNSEFCKNVNFKHIFKMDSTVANDSIKLVLQHINLSNNIVTASLFSILGVIPLFEGNTTFSTNTANIMLRFSKYIQLDKKALLSISNNRYNPAEKTIKRFIFEKTHTSSEECPFQLDMTTANITFCNNSGYYRELYGDYLKYNCTWIQSLSTKVKLPKHMYSKQISNCEITNEEYFKWSTTIFLCNSTSDLTFDEVRSEQAANMSHLKFEHNKLYPGQTVSVKLIHRKHNISVYTDSDDTTFTNIAPACQLNTLTHKVDLIYDTCTELRYTIKSTNISMCLLNLRTATKRNTLYVFKIQVSACPIGFSLDSDVGKCRCNAKLQVTLKGIICSISQLTFTLPINAWMSKTTEGDEIMYTRFCFSEYCTYLPQRIITLDDANNQCLSGRTGIACGQCAQGLSTVFGTSRCKKCSNFGLFSIPLFAVAGMLLVILLFMLNITALNGNIYGFIFFVNTVRISTLQLFATKNEIAYVLILLSNLDLGIEVCFYDGMTAYVATWLQFVFPLYVLSIVAALVIASRYISTVEKITRKRVIPVITTLYLLSYNKIMMITLRVLFSSIKIHFLSSGKTKLYWLLDTGVSLGDFIVLYLFCGAVLLILIIPTNVVLLFTKRCYRFRFVVVYLKPFIDVYQAPFKDNCRYFLGLEFLLRAIAYMVKFYHFDYTAAIHCAMIILYVAYLSWYKPFKNKYSLLLYLLYTFLLGGINITFMDYVVLSTGSKEKHAVALNIFVYLAFIEALLILAHHLWKYHIRYHKLIIVIENYMKTNICKYFTVSKKRTSHVDLQVYEEYQEELLALSPDV